MNDNRVKQFLDSAQPSPIKGDGFEVRADSNGELDEFIAKGANIHLERMDESAWWMGIYLPDGSEWHLRFGTMSNRSQFYCFIEKDSAGDHRCYRGDNTTYKVRHPS